MCPKHAKNNTIFTMWKIRPSGCDSFYFGDMIKNAPCEFSAILDVKSDAQSNDAVFNASNKNLLVIGENVE